MNSNHAEVLCIEFTLIQSISKLKTRPFLSPIVTCYTLDTSTTDFEGFLTRLPTRITLVDLSGSQKSSLCRYEELESPNLARRLKE